MFRMSDIIMVTEILNERNRVD